jgi:hypothetical protein
VRCDTESLFLLGFSDEEFLAALVMASSGAFFNKLLVGWIQWVDAALSLNPPCIENKRQNRSLGSHLPERCPG